MPAILNWAVQGCLEWQRIGLKPPETVIEATREYKSEVDPLTRFLETRAIGDVEEFVRADALFEDYRFYCLSLDREPPASQKIFGKYLTTRGYKSKDKKVKVGDDWKTRKVYIGFKLPN